MEQELFLFIYGSSVCGLFNDAVGSPGYKTKWGD
jgi:hypothetical protein